MPRQIHRLSPVVVAFIASLLLSLIARLGSIINRDGMLYVNTAQAYLDGGFAAAKALFAWPFLPIVMAYVSRLSGLEPENAGYLVNALFMAGTCALMVACVRRESPELAWIACLTVIALPGLNEYRNELLREFGCWFFIMLAFWLAQKWNARPNWMGAIGIQLSLLCAALFRPEALTLYIALTGWQLAFAADRRWHRVAMIGTLPIIGGALLVTLYWTGHLGNDRLAGEFARLNFSRFDAKADILASGLIEYARGNAHTVLFFGSLALIPIRLIEKFALFLVPLYFFVADRSSRHPDMFGRLLWCAIAVHLVVLSVFVTDLQFLAGRYVCLILLFSTPFIAAGLKRMFTRWPGLQRPTIALAIAMALANVVYTGQGKAYFIDAGKWLAANVPADSRAYIDSGRAAFHARWHTITLQPRGDRGRIEDAARSGEFDVFILERSRKEDPVDDWLEQACGLEIVTRFGSPNTDEVIIARPRGQP